jgi:hypothetical protein
MTPKTASISKPVADVEWTPPAARREIAELHAALEHERRRADAECRRADLAVEGQRRAWAAVAGRWTSRASRDGGVTS